LVSHIKGRKYIEGVREKGAEREVMGDWRKFGNEELYDK
jgi:hypothetical protein